MTIAIYSLMVFSLFLICSKPAYAYLDPGAGSFILQMLIAGVLGALFTIKIYWGKLKNILAQLFGKKVEKPSDKDSSA